MTMTLETFLQQHALAQPSKVAVVCGQSRLTYAELFSLTQQRAHELRSSGLTPGQVHLFRASQDAAFLCTYFATHMLGAVAAPLERDIPQQRIDDLQALCHTATLPQGAADVLFTTGTTGQSKGVIISHDTIVAEAENLAESQGFSADTVFIISGPLNHIGSLSKIFPVIMLGGTLIITEGMKDVDAFFQALDYPDGRLATFLVPANIRILMQLGGARIATYARRLDFIETGAAPMAQSDMEELCRLLPHTRLYNTYASTETGIIATYNFNSAECIAGCLGKAMKHARFFITPEGMVACQGRTLMMGYLGDAEQTARILHDDTLFTSDCGYIDKQGRLRLTGRSGDVINIGGFKVNPAEVENAALAHASVKDCICVPTQHPVIGTVLKLHVVLHSEHTLNKRELAKHIAQSLERYKVPHYYEEADSIRRTYNGKLDRKAYQ